MMLLMEPRNRLKTFQKMPKSPPTNSAKGLKKQPMNSQLELKKLLAGPEGKTKRCLQEF